MGASQPSAESGDYQIERSLRFNSEDITSLKKTPSTAGNRRVWTWSGWVKRSGLGSPESLFTVHSSSDNAGYINFYFNSDKLQISGWSSVYLTSNAVFKDTSAWYHIVCAVDTTNAITADRIKFFVNGVRLTSFATENQPSQNTELPINNNTNHGIATNISYTNATHKFNGSLADVHFIDGLSLSPAAFGSFDSTGVWNPKAFALPAPNNGTTWGADQMSGSFDGSNNWTKVFDGDLSTYGYPGIGQTVTFTPDDPIACTSLRVYARNDANGGGVKVNGTYQGDITTTPTWYDYTPDSHSITTISWRRESSGSIGCQVYAVEIDGVLLVDDITDSADRNNPNDGATWSGDISATGGWLTTNTGTFTFNGAVPNMGSSGVSTYGNDTGGTITFAPTGGITYNHSIELYTDAGHTYTVNGGSNQTFGPSTGQSNGTWYTLVTGSGTLTSLTWTPQNASYRPSSAAMRIDGHLLVDDTDDNSCHLKFSDVSTREALGTDSFGNGNWTVTNLIPYDSSNIYTLTASGEAFHNSYPASNAFDGNTATLAGHGANSTSNQLHYVPPAQHTSVTKLRFFKDYTSNQTEIRLKADSTWGDWFDTPGSNGQVWVDISSEVSGSKVNGIDWRMKSGISNGIYICAIEVNDVILTNSGLGDSFTDSPSNYGTDTGAGGEVRGTFPTFNPWDSYSGLTLSQGNLTVDHDSGGSMPHARATIGMSSGKWYFEVTRGTGEYGTIGIATQDSDLANYAGKDSNAVGGYEIYTENTEKWAGGSGGSSSGYLTESWDSDGDVASCYFDADNGTIGFMVNGTDMGNAFTSIDMTKTYFFQCGSQGTKLTANFGQRAFKYTAPSGYKALCTTNLSDTFSGDTVNNPSKYFDAIKYLGTGSAQTVYGSSFQPDFFWGKGADKDQGHALVDVKRGTGFTLQSNNANQDYSSNNIVTALNSTGFSLGTDAVVNEDGKTYIAWLWNAPTSFSLTTGDIDSSGYKSNDAGFSIVKYAGNGSGSASQEVPHGLAVRPDMIIVKALDDSTASYSQWLVKHKEMAANNNIKLNDSAAQWNPAGDGWVELGDNATKFKLVKGSSGFSNVNNSGKNYIAYCFAPVAGYSAMGKYVGTSGEPFVHTGFRPAYVFLRRMDNNASWYVFDNGRSRTNEATVALRPNSNVVNQSYNLSLFANGFLVESSSDGDINAAGGNYLWYAVAENPMKTARAK